MKKRKLFLFIAVISLISISCFIGTKKNNSLKPTYVFEPDKVRVLEIGDVIYEQQDKDYQLKYIYSGRTVDNILWIFKHSYTFKNAEDKIRTIETPLRTERGDNGVYLSLAGNYIVYLTIDSEDRAVMKVISQENELAKIKNVEYHIGENYLVNIGENIHSVIKDEYALVFTYCGLTKDNKIWILKQKYFYGSDIIDSNIETVELTEQQAKSYKLTDDYFVSIEVGDFQRLLIEVILPI